MKKIVRKIALKILRVIDFGDIRIRHHYTGKKIKIHSFKHRGYWYHGESRERSTMKLFEKLIGKDDVIFEIGGHIGYMTLHFASIVRDGSGRVLVFEPGENNLPYLRHNIQGDAKIKLEECAVSDVDGTVSFLLEDLSGQNNTILEDYKSLDESIKSAGVKVTSRRVMVKCVRLDTYVQQSDVAPDFIKIDVEGAEMNVLTGMGNVLHGDRPPRIMVEVTYRLDEVWHVLDKAGYVAFDADGVRIDAERLPVGNWFALHCGDAAALRIMSAGGAS